MNAIHPIYKKRMLRLARFLERFKPTKGRRFDMGTWGEHHGRHKAHPHYCGTTACALGWAGTIPEFRRAGLKLEFTDEVMATISYRGFKDLSAGMAFFHLDEGNAQWVFGQAGTAKQVAKRFRHLAAGKDHHECDTSS